MKKQPKKIFILVIFVFVFVLLFSGILLFYSTDIPETSSVQQVIDSLTDKGLQPNDVTDTAIDNFQNAGLKTCLIAEKDGFRFEFYDFDNNGSALKVYRQAHTIIVTERMATPNVEISNGKIGYKFYSLNTNGIYSVAIYVNHTAVYAYCDSTEQATLNQILADIGYVKPADAKESPSWLFPTIRLIYFILCIPMAMLGRHWFWLAACQSANVSINDMDEQEINQKERKKYILETSSRKRKTKIILLVYNFSLLPEYICVVLALINFGVPQLTGLLNRLGAIIPAIIIATAIIGSITRKMESKRINQSRE